MSLINGFRAQHAPGTSKSADFQKHLWLGQFLHKAWVIHPMCWPASVRINPAVPPVPSTITGTHKCLSKSQSLGPTPGNASELSRKQPAQILAKVSEDPSQSKTSASIKSGVARPKKPINVRKVVANGVLMRGRIHADGNGHQPYKEQRRE